MNKTRLKYYNEINTSFDALYDAFGVPTHDNRIGEEALIAGGGQAYGNPDTDWDGKVTVQWNVKIGGKTVCICDYKQTKAYDDMGVDSVTDVNEWRAVFADGNYGDSIPNIIQHKILQKLKSVKDGYFAKITTNTYLV